MNDMAPWSAAAHRVGDRKASAGRRAPAWREASVALNALATALVAVAGFALTLVFAATLAVVLVLALGLFVLAALAWRVRPRLAPVKPGRSGHAWVACRWDDRGR